MSNTSALKVRVPYAQAVYGEEEVAAVNRVLQDPFKLSPGKSVAEFEQGVCGRFGKKHGIMVNSGSSANLLAIEVLNLPAGSEVITPALTFGTTVAPLLQKQLRPVFVDVQHGSYQIDVSQIEALIGPRTKVLMIPSLLGNIPDLAEIRALADKHHLTFIEDSCDTIGATFNGAPTGDYSDVSTTSFYASHIITAAATGGMVMFHDDALAQRARVLAAWGRSSTLFGTHEQSEDIERRFSGAIGNLPYDAKFIFSEVGYNFQPTEMSAAFGVEQLRRLDDFALLRKQHFSRLISFFTRFEEYFILPQQLDCVETNWLAFPLTIRDGAPFSRQEITRHLEEQNIQTRPVFTGNILRQPAYRHLIESQSVKEFAVSDEIMQRGFVLGCHHGLTSTQLDYVEEVITSFIASR